MRQLVNDLRIEVCIAFRQREHDAATVRLLWGDRVADRVRDDFVASQRPRRCPEDQRHLLGKGEVQPSADVIVCPLGTSTHTIDVTGERRQVVQFEMFSFGLQP
jgi:hypothetical protein